MNVTIRKDELEDIINTKFGISSAVFMDDGTIVIDTVLEKVGDSKSDLQRLNSIIRFRPDENEISKMYERMINQYRTNGYYFNQTPSTGILSKAVNTIRGHK